MAKEIPVYLFVGFLESGKTKFIQETFEDPNFDSGDKTLLLICEEGEEAKYPKSSKFAISFLTVALDTFNESQIDFEPTGFGIFIYSSTIIFNIALCLSVSIYSPLIQVYNLIITLILAMSIDEC